MNYFNTSRVAIIDDRREEAIPMIEALGRQGIGSIYFDGVNEKNLPEKPHEGIRVVFIDMDLDVGGGQIKQIISKTTNVLKRIVSQKSSPCLIIAWTKHEDYVDEFDSAVKNAMPDLIRPPIIRMDKQSSDDFDVNKISSIISYNLDKYWPLQIIWIWEQLAHDAATLTSREIVEIAGEEFKNNGFNAAMKVLKSTITTMLEASGGKSVQDNKDYLDSFLFETLASINIDSIENIPRDIDNAKIAELLNHDRLSNEYKAKLNTKLLTSGLIGENTTIKPGNTYISEWCAQSKIEILGMTVDLEGLYDDIDKEAFYNGKNAFIKSIRQQIARNEHQNTPQEDKKNLLIQEVREQIKSKCRIGLVEHTPSCDFFQKKQRVVRFVAGYFVPEKLVGCFANLKCDYLNILEPMYFPPLEASYCLILNAHFLYTQNLPYSDISSPDFRLRGDTISHIQHWLAGHSSRVGRLTI